MDIYEKRAEIAKALAHPVRLQVLDVLREDEACVCHLEAVLGQRQAYISQQLARLRDAGLVVDRRDGLNVFYALADDSIAALLDALHSSAEAVARANGETLAEMSLATSHPACSCPKCAEKQLITPTFLRGEPHVDD